MTRAYVGIEVKMGKHVCRLSMIEISDFGRSPNFSYLKQA